jgi:3-dehydroquinate dehydratase/shikimate dehydrogenase
LPQAAIPLFPLRVALSPVCVAVAATNMDALFRAAMDALAESSFIELRLDALVETASAIERVRQFCAGHPRAAVIATCRRIAGGGGFTGSAEEQLVLLEELASTGVTLADVELETLEAVSPKRLKRFGAAIARHGTRLLVSAHDFETTGDLDGTLARLRTLGAPAQPAIYKVVSTARGLADNVRMLRFIKETSEAFGHEVPLVGICMGEAGLVSRVLALRAGALFTFASATGSGGTAPGQVSARLLLGEYRAADLGPATKIYGVAGNPIGHSLSPALHNAGFRAAAPRGAGFRAAGLDAVYLPLHTDSIDGLLELVRGVPLAGLSVTMPWKVEILPRLDEVDALAAEIGAVNTVVVRDDGSLFGTNTDVAAILEPLRQRLTLKDARVLVLGAGGAARAAVFALRSAGAQVSIWNRTVARAEQLARETGATVASAGALGGFAVVVQATAAGMQGQVSMPLPLGPDELAGVRVVFEMVYRPAETPLTRLARSLGIEVIEGLEMFTHQGLRQWELWTGRPAPAAAMSRAVKNELARQDTVSPEMKEQYMAKNYDAVDRLMQLATDKPLPGPERTGSGRTGPERTGPEQTGPERTGPEQTGLRQAGHERAGTDRTSPERTGPEPTSQELRGKERARGQLNPVAPAPEAGSSSYPSAGAGVPTTDTEALDVLAAQVTATEPQPPTFSEAATETAALAVPRTTPGERGRQLLGALRPFLPVLGGALRMVDHGAVQAVARLLPLFEGAPAGAQRASTPASARADQPALAALLATLEKHDAATTDALKEQGLRLTAAEDHIKRVRESVERMVAEEGAMSNRLREVTDRARLLTAGVIILFMLAVAEMVLLMIFLHR